jgi:hypothetical protein
LFSVKGLEIIPLTQVTVVGTFREPDSDKMPVPGCPGFYVRVPEYVTRSVVFFGFEDARPGKGGIDCVGTGFLVAHEGFGYLATAAHVAKGLGENPFLVRLNKKDGTSQNLQTDGVEWFAHPDPTVDAAVVPFAPLAMGDFEALHIPTETAMFRTGHFPGLRVGPGDLTYTTGLFRLMSGERRNLAVVHSGAIALMPGEKIPVKNWSDGEKTIFCDGYLVETHSLDGLSGSPVFVRPTMPFLSAPPGAQITSNMPRDLLGKLTGVGARFEPLLLGLWQGSWDAPPDEIVAIQSGKGARVSVGMGIVVPAERIIELLEQDEMKKARTEAKNKAAANRAAGLDAAFPAGKVSSPPASDANPNALEDFNSLLNAAVKKPPQED